MEFDPEALFLDLESVGLTVIGLGGSIMFMSARIFSIMNCAQDIILILGKNNEAWADDFVSRLSPHFKFKNKRALAI